MSIAALKKRIRSLKKITPDFIWSFGKFFYVHAARTAVAVKFRVDLRLKSSRTARKLRNIQGKERLDVVFLPVNVSMWKYDGVFRLMSAHPRFSPRIILAPQAGLPAAERIRMVREMKECFSAEGFPITEFDEERESREHFLAKQNPDIIFIAQGYGGFLFTPKDFPRALVCYTPYSFVTSACKATLNLPCLNLAWKLFFSSKAHLEEARRLMSNHADNVVVSGHSNADLFLSKTHVPADEWKLAEDRSRKRIIYAPHWSVNPKSLLPYATFLENGEFMQELAKTFFAETQWVFKPHPWLYRELCRLPEWGKERADAYYSAWKNLPNGTIAEGDYIDLFLTSDAMIHDSGSFRAEYFYTKKPVMYLVKDGQLKNDGKIGHIAYNTHYHGRTGEDIEKFIKEVVLGGNDPMKAAREQFYEKYLLPPNGQSVAQNILDEIERGLGWK